MQQLLALFDAVGRVDAVACTAGNVHFGPLETMEPAQFEIGLRDKLMGQINPRARGSRARRTWWVVYADLRNPRPRFIRFGASASLVNGALESFVRAAAIELHDHRINAVSPTVLIESMAAYGAYFPGFEPVPASRVALAFSKSIEGAQTGQVYRVE